MAGYCTGVLIMLSNLCDKTFTLINQIPQSQTNKKKIAWHKHTLTKCDVVGGVYDRSQHTLIKTSGEYTAYIKDWERYIPAQQYYNMSDCSDKFTIAKGDLIIFSDIPEDAPSDGDSFDLLVDKYSGNCMTVSDFELYINYRSDGKPWKTNHIEVIKR